ncbi:MAG: hypothetical protein H6604_08985 [Flavobacteriales bacterium]|nr:hypothetical protein [Flavobacteriales bacterium]
MYLSSNTNLYYYGARYYDPRISIWLSVDPLVEQIMDVVPAETEDQNHIFSVIDAFITKKKVQKIAL